MTARILQSPGLETFANRCLCAVHSKTGSLTAADAPQRMQPCAVSTAPRYIVGKGAVNPAMPGSGCRAKALCSGSSEGFSLGFEISDDAPRGMLRGTPLAFPAAHDVSGVGWGSRFAADDAPVFSSRRACSLIRANVPGSRYGWQRHGCGLALCLAVVPQQAAEPGDLGKPFVLLAEGWTDGTNNGRLSGCRMTLKSTSCCCRIIRTHSSEPQGLPGHAPSCGQLPEITYAMARNDHTENVSGIGQVSGHDPPEPECAANAGPVAGCAYAFETGHRDVQRDMIESLRDGVFCTVFAQRAIVRMHLRCPRTERPDAESRPCRVDRGASVCPSSFGSVPALCNEISQRQGLDFDTGQTGGKWYSGFSDANFFVFCTAFFSSTHAIRPCLI